ncbi:MAG: 3-oxoadipyl-CoA thiolase [Betaproteobacteria bacterium]|nr:3-oxoadipyl-CoA thiolase [Betaproteobacteria bacterium]
MPEAFICDATRTPIGRYGGALSGIRTDDLAALPLKALMARNTSVDWSQVGDVCYGNANQAGEDNRNVAHMATLLSGLPQSVPGCTVNRLCGSGLDALGYIARAIKAGDISMGISGGVESMSRAPFVMNKADSAFSRNTQIFDTTIGWRFINPLMREKYGVDAMPETAENVADDFKVSRLDQDAFALRSQQRYFTAFEQGLFKEEITPVTIAQAKGEPKIIAADEHPRQTSMEILGKLKGVVRPNGTVTAGNASGVNDGAAAILIADEATAKRFGLTPRVRIVATAAAGVAPRIMGIGPAPAVQLLLERTKISLDQVDVIELNEAFAAQGLAALRMLNLADDAPHVNAQGGAIALGHPLGMSGARLALTAMYQLQRKKGRYAICTMCIGVGQGIAVLLERV